MVGLQQITQLHHTRYKNEWQNKTSTFIFYNHLNIDNGTKGLQYIFVRKELSPHLTNNIIQIQ